MTQEPDVLAPLPEKLFKTQETPKEIKATPEQRTAAIRVNKCSKCVYLDPGNACGALGDPCGHWPEVVL